MDIVESFDEYKYYDNNYNDEHNNYERTIPSNAVVAAEADAPAVLQTRAFAAADAFLGRDIALLSSSSLLSLSKLLLSKNKRLLSWSFHRYNPEEREGENFGATRRRSQIESRSASQSRSVSRSLHVSWILSPRRHRQQLPPLVAAKQGRMVGQRRDPKTGRKRQRMERRQQRRRVIQRRSPRSRRGTRRSRIRGRGTVPSILPRAPALPTPRHSGC